VAPTNATSPPAARLDEGIPPDVGLRTLAAFSLRRLVRVPATTIFGFDFFISYARRDGSRYAASLYRQLEAHSCLTCFDKTDLLPADDLPESLARAVRRSRFTVVVDTPGARASRYVGDEIVDAQARRRQSLIRIAAPGPTPLGYAPEHGDVPTWQWLPADARTRLGNAISVDDPSSKEQIDTGVVGADVVQQILASQSRFKKLRRFYSLAAVLLVSLVALLFVSAIRRSISLNARELAVAAAGTPDDLRALYSKAESLATVAGIAARVPYVLPPEMLADVQDSLRATLRVPVQSTRVRLANPRTFESRYHRYLLADEGRRVFWWSTRGIELARIGADATGEVLLAPVTENLLDWSAAYVDGTARITLAFGDRLETWTSRDGETPTVQRSCDDRMWIMASLSDRIAVVVSQDSIAAISAEKCAALWSSALETRPTGTSQVLGVAPAGTIVAYDTGTAVHILDGATGKPIGLPLPHTSRILAWSFDPTGRYVGYGDGNTVVLVGPGGERRLAHNDPVVGVQFSPDGRFVSSSTMRNAWIWSVEPRARDTETEDLAPAQYRLSKEMAFAGNQQLWVATRPLPDEGSPQLRAMLFPGGLWQSPRPLTIDDMVGLQVQGRTILAEGQGTIEILLRPPDVSPGASVAYGDLPLDFDATGQASASFTHSDRLLLEQKPPPLLRSAGTIWIGDRLPDGDRWQKVAASPPTSEDSPPRVSIPEEWTDCRTRSGSKHAVLICPDLVRVFRIRNGSSARADGSWAVERWTDLHCASRTKGCSVTDAGVDVFDVRLSEDESEATLLHLVGRRYITVTHPLSFGKLRTILAGLAARLDGSE
jgi:hypothetical protein